MPHPSGAPDNEPQTSALHLQRSQSQQSSVARSAMMKQASSSAKNGLDGSSAAAREGPSNPVANGATSCPKQPDGMSEGLKPKPDDGQQGGIALNDTPSTTAPPSPNIIPFGPPRRQNSGDRNRAYPTTLDIPGLTKSRVSPDGKISSRDVGSKLVIVMVGLPARGKSYITKKMARYLNWLQHDTKIFNVGEKRRVVAGGRSPLASKRSSMNVPHRSVLGSLNGPADVANAAAQILINGEKASLPTTPATPGMPELQLPEPGQGDEGEARKVSEAMDQSASFFDPRNRKAALLREQCAIETLDDLLDYILNQGGSVGILDATNSTLQRRELIMNHIRTRAGPDLNVLFCESLCYDENLLERNMRLKLSGPDYRDKDPETSLIDFKKRVALYERGYVSIGEYEEKRNIPFVQMIDVGRKVISHQIKGFLSAQAVYYLLNFNLSPRQIWICRHGQSVDNVTGKIGGDSDLSPHGQMFAQALARFISAERTAWDIRQLEKERNSHLPPRPGDDTPPNPHCDPPASPATDDASDGTTPVSAEQKNFCVWTSMLKRSIQTGAPFDGDDFECKQMRMLDELFAGYLEGLTYAEIMTRYPAEYARRKSDKLHYRYPGPGGEGYLDVINRLRPVIVELERMTDHCLLITHRSVARVLLAYFLGLRREVVTHLEVPLGMLYCLEPKPYGVDFRAYRYDDETCSFEWEPDYELKRGE